MDTSKNTTSQGLKPQTISQGADPLSSMLGQPRPNVEEIKKRMFEEAKEDNPYLLGS